MTLKSILDLLDTIMSNPFVAVSTKTRAGFLKTKLRGGYDLASIFGAR